MEVRILDLDGSLPPQSALTRFRPLHAPAPEWGPAIRLACGFPRFRQFEKHLAALLGSSLDVDPWTTLHGSGDFHHVTLALLHRRREPLNLLVVDNHPDWMRGLPFLHCGTWLWHAARLPQVQNIFHVGGDVDFDNHYRWLAPWHLLRSGKIKVFPAVRQFQRGPWRTIENPSLRPGPATPVTAERMAELLRPHQEQLSRWPLYVTIDKDVMKASEAVVNWDSGHLELVEICAILSAFQTASRDRLAGADLVGDWSPVQVQGWFRRSFHLTEHPHLEIDPNEAARVNEQVNLTLLAALERRAIPDHLVA